MPLLEPFLYVGAAATVLIALGWRPWRAESAPLTGPLASALLPACAFWLAWLPLHGGTSIPWPPREGMHWTFCHRHHDHQHHALWRVIQHLGYHRHL